MKQCILINDYSAFGSNSLAAALPVLAAFGIKAHAFPTAVLSAQTEFENHAKTPVFLPPFFEQAASIIRGEVALVSGFLQEPCQAEQIKNYLLSRSETLYVLDPVLGDGGTFYQGFSHQNAEAILPLLPHATVVTPNLTEACLLTGSNYPLFLEECAKKGASAARPLAVKLNGLGAKNVIITGIMQGKEIQTLLVCEGTPYCFSQAAETTPRSGTGDLFAALLTAFLLCGNPLPDATERAAHYVAKALHVTESEDGRLGTDFEKILPELTSFSPYAK